MKTKRRGAAVSLAHREHLPRWTLRKSAKRARNFDHPAGSWRKHRRESLQSTARSTATSEVPLAFAGAARAIDRYPPRDA